MAYSVTLPELGESVTEGTVIQWLKQEGDTVDVDEPLLELSTDKVDTEVPSPVAGTLQRILVKEDETVEVGSQLAVIDDGTSTSPEPAAVAPVPERPKDKSEVAPPTTPVADSSPPAHETARASRPVPLSEADGARQATPLVRRLAHDHGIDLSTLAAEGSRVRKHDVLAAIETNRAGNGVPPESASAGAPQRPAADASPPSQPDAEVAAAPYAGAATRTTVQKTSRIRQMIAQRTRESLQASAQLTQVFEVDVTRIARLRQQAKAGFASREGVKLTFLPFFAKAAVEALKQHPNVNAYLREEAREIVYHGQENLAVAVDTESGLLAPVIRDAGQLNLAGLARAIAGLASKARSNTISANELSGGTFTVTNLGSNGALFDTPIINQPQSGILGVGAVVKRPVVMTDDDGQDSISIRSMAYLALTYDHRLIDGADAGRFLTTVKNRLEDGRFEDELRV